MRVRHYGLLANHGRAEKLGRCPALLGQSAAQANRAEAVAEGEATRRDGRRCQACGQGRMRVVEPVAAAAPRREVSS